MESRRHEPSTYQVRALFISSRRDPDPVASGYGAHASTSRAGPSTTLPVIVARCRTEGDLRRRRSSPSFARSDADLQAARGRRRRSGYRAPSARSSSRVARDRRGAARARPGRPRRRARRRPARRLARRLDHGAKRLEQLERRREPLLPDRARARGAIGSSIAGSISTFARRPRPRTVDLQVALDDARRATERRRAGEHVIGEQAERVDIGARIDRLAAHLLGRHRRRRAEHPARRRQAGPS